MTLTGIQPGGRFGILDLGETGTTLNGFREKTREDGGWINDGFMVMEPGVFGYLGAEEHCVLERKPLGALTLEGELGIYKHSGFWQCMDTQRDRGMLEHLWSCGKAPWKMWEDT